jgi:hypothetical protein
MASQKNAPNTILKSHQYSERGSIGTVAYIVRPSAYAIVRSKSGKVAVVRTSVGSYLVGGGIQAGETPNKRSSGRRRKNAAFCSSLDRYWEEQWI